MFGLFLFRKIARPRYRVGSRATEVERIGFLKTQYIVYSHYLLFPRKRYK